jgi:predicted MFS family arabinose efflux permease
MSDLKSTFHFYPQMLYVLIMLALDSVVLGMYSNQVIRLMPNEPDKDLRNKLAGIITIFIGLGSIIGGFFGGMISDKFGLLKTGRSILLFYLFSAICSFIAIYINLYEMACFIGFLWGCSYYLF